SEKANKTGFFERVLLAVSPCGPPLCLGGSAGQAPRRACRRARFGAPYGIHRRVIKPCETALFESIDDPFPSSFPSFLPAALLDQAASGIEQPHAVGMSLDHLVSASDDRGGNREAQHPCGLHVDH